jgi:hypothetical protein
VRLGCGAYVVWTEIIRSLAFVDSPLPFRALVGRSGRFSASVALVSSLLSPRAAPASAARRAGRDRRAPVPIRGARAAASVLVLIRILVGVHCNALLFFIT